MYAQNWFNVLFSMGFWRFHAVSANRILWLYSGFFWYHRIVVVHLHDSVGAFWAIKYHSLFFCRKCYDWQTVEGLQLVMHQVVSHYQKILVYILWEIMLKCVRNVTGMASWCRLVTCKAFFIVCDGHLCLHFTVKYDHLHCIVTSSSILCN